MAIQNLEARDAAPATGCAAVTPSDSTTFGVTRALWVGGAGTITVVFADGSTATFSGVGGVLLPFRVVKVMATNTTATGIVAIY